MQDRKMNAILTKAASVFALLVAILSCGANTVAVGAAQEKAVLTFALHTSFGEFGYNSSGIVPAVNLALEHINANPNYLSNYTLEHSAVGNTKVRIEY